MKFETINGTLCIMTEPVPLTETAKFPCVVQFNPSDHRTINFRNRKPFILHNINNEGYVHYELAYAAHYSLFEIIGYPVADHSAAWALYRMMQGEKVHHVGISAERATMVDEPRYWYIANEVVRDSCNDADTDTLEQWLKYVLPTGWQLYVPDQFRDATKKVEPDVVDELNSLRGEVNWHIRSRTTLIGYYIRTGKGKDNAIDAVEKLEAFADKVMADRVVKDPIFAIGEQVTDGVVTGYVTSIENGLAWVKAPDAEYHISLCNLKAIEPAVAEPEVKCPHYDNKLDHCIDFKLPKPRFEVGDWVEYNHAGRKRIGKVRRVSTDMVDLYMFDQSKAPFWCYMGFCKKFSSPSGVVVHIGCLSGTVKRWDSTTFLMFHGNCKFSKIHLDALDTPTRELMESLLKAQEGKC